MAGDLFSFGDDCFAGLQLGGPDGVVFGLLGLFKRGDLLGEGVQAGLGGAEVAHHVALGQLFAQVGDGLLHVRGGRLGADALFQQDNLRDDVVVLPGEVAQGFVIADARVLADGMLLAVDGQENVAVTFNTAPAGRFGQRRGGGHSGRRGGGGGR